MNLMSRTMDSASMNWGSGISSWHTDPDVVDTRDVDPQDRYALVIGHIAWLKSGQVLHLIVDQDPAAIRLHVESRPDGPYGWRCAKVAPQLWKVRIRKTSSAPTHPLFTDH